ATSGVCKPATSAGRVRQEFTAAARRVRRAQLRALLRDGRDAALPPPRTGQHLEAAVGSCRRVQPEPDSAPVAGCGHAARAEKPLWHACFVRLSTLPGSDKSESALQKPDLRVRCQVLREFAYPATSPAVQKIRYLHHGLLGGDLPDDATAGGFAIGAIPSTGCGPEEIAVGIDEDTANRPPSVVASRGKVGKVGIKPGSVALGSLRENAHFMRPSEYR